VLHDANGLYVKDAAEADDQLPASSVKVSARVRDIITRNLASSSSSDQDAAGWTPAAAADMPRVEQLSEEIRVLQVCTTLPVYGIIQSERIELNCVQHRSTIQFISVHLFRSVRAYTPVSDISLNTDCNHFRLSGESSVRKKIIIGLQKYLFVIATARRQTDIQHSTVQSSTLIKRGTLLISNPSKPNFS